MAFLHHQHTFYCFSFISTLGPVITQAHAALERFGGDLVAIGTIALIYKTALRYRQHFPLRNSKKSEYKHKRRNRGIQSFILINHETKFESS